MLPIIAFLNVCDGSREECDEVEMSFYEWIESSPFNGIILGVTATTLVFTVFLSFIFRCNSNAVCELRSSQSVQEGQVAQFGLGRNPKSAQTLTKEQESLRKLFTSCHKRKSHGEKQDFAVHAVPSGSKSKDIKLKRRASKIIDHCSVDNTQIERVPRHPPPQPPPIVQKFQPITAGRCDMKDEDTSVTRLTSNSSLSSCISNPNVMSSPPKVCRLIVPVNQQTSSAGPVINAADSARGRVSNHKCTDDGCVWKIILPNEDSFRVNITCTKLDHPALGMPPRGSVPASTETSQAQGECNKLHHTKERSGNNYEHYFERVNYGNHKVEDHSSQAEESSHCAITQHQMVYTSGQPKLLSCKQKTYSLLRGCGSLRLNNSESRNDPASKRKLTYKENSRESLSSHCKQAKSAISHGQSSELTRQCDSDLYPEPRIVETNIKVMKPNKAVRSSCSSSSWSSAEKLSVSFKNKPAAIEQARADPNQVYVECGITTCPQVGSCRSVKIEPSTRAGEDSRAVNAGMLGCRGKLAPHEKLSLSFAQKPSKVNSATGFLFQSCKTDSIQPACRNTTTQRKRITKLKKICYSEMNNLGKTSNAVQSSASSDETAMSILLYQNSNKKQSDEHLRITYRPCSAARLTAQPVPTFTMKNSASVDYKIRECANSYELPTRSVVISKHHVSTNILDCTAELRDIMKNTMNDLERCNKNSHIELATNSSSDTKKDLAENSHKPFQDSLIFCNTFCNENKIDGFDIYGPCKSVSAAKHQVTSNETPGPPVSMQTKLRVRKHNLKRYSRIEKRQFNSKRRCKLNRGLRALFGAKTQDEMQTTKSEVSSSFVFPEQCHEVDVTSNSRKYHKPVHKSPGFFMAENSSFSVDGLLGSESFICYRGKLPYQSKRKSVVNDASFDRSENFRCEETRDKWYLSDTTQNILIPFHQTVEHLTFTQSGVPKPSDRSFYNIKENERRCRKLAAMKPAKNEANGSKGIKGKCKSASRTEKESIASDQSLNKCEMLMIESSSNATDMWSAQSTTSQQYSTSKETSQEKILILEAVKINSSSEKSSISTDSITLTDPYSREQNTCSLTELAARYTAFSKKFPKNKQCDGKFIADRSKRDNARHGVPSRGLKILRSNKSRTSFVRNRCHARQGYSKRDSGSLVSEASTLSSNDGATKELAPHVDHFGALKSRHGQNTKRVYITHHNNRHITTPTRRDLEAYSSSKKGNKNKDVSRKNRACNKIDRSLKSLLSQVNRKYGINVQLPSDAYSECSFMKDDEASISTRNSPLMNSSSPENVQGRKARRDQSYPSFTGNVVSNLIGFLSASPDTLPRRNSPWQPVHSCGDSQARVVMFFEDPNDLLSVVSVEATVGSNSSVDLRTTPAAAFRKNRLKRIRPKVAPLKDLKADAAAIGHSRTKLISSELSFTDSCSRFASMSESDLRMLDQGHFKSEVDFTEIRKSPSDIETYRCGKYKRALLLKNGLSPPEVSNASTSKWNMCSLDVTDILSPSICLTQGSSELRREKLLCNIAHYQKPKAVEDTVQVQRSAGECVTQSDHHKFRRARTTVVLNAEQISYMEIVPKRGKFRGLREIEESRVTKKLVNNGRDTDKPLTKAGSQAIDSVNNTSSHSDVFYNIVILPSKTRNERSTSGCERVNTTKPSLSETRSRPDSAQDKTVKSRAFLKHDSNLSNEKRTSAQLVKSSQCMEANVLKDLPIKMLPSLITLSHNKKSKDCVDLSVGVVSSLHSYCHPSKPADRGNTKAEKEFNKKESIDAKQQDLEKYRNPVDHHRAYGLEKTNIITHERAAAEEQKRTSKDMAVDYENTTTAEVTRRKRKKLLQNKADDLKQPSQPSKYKSDADSRAHSSKQEKTKVFSFTKDSIQQTSLTMDQLTSEQVRTGQIIDPPKREHLATIEHVSQTDVKLIQEKPQKVDKHIQCPTLGSQAAIELMDLLSLIKAGKNYYSKTSRNKKQYSPRSDDQLNRETCPTTISNQERDKTITEEKKCNLSLNGNKPTAREPNINFSLESCNDVAENSPKLFDHKESGLQISKASKYESFKNSKRKDQEGKNMKKMEPHSSENQMNAEHHETADLYNSLIMKECSESRDMAIIKKQKDYKIVSTTGNDLASLKDVKSIELPCGFQHNTDLRAAEGQARERNSIEQVKRYRLNDTIGDNLVNELLVDRSKKEAREMTSKAKSEAYNECSSLQASRQLTNTTGLQHNHKKITRCANVGTWNSSKANITEFKENVSTNSLRDTTAYGATDNKKMPNVSQLNDQEKIEFLRGLKTRLDMIRSYPVCDELTGDVTKTRNYGKSQFPALDCKVSADGDGLQNNSRAKHSVVNKVKEVIKKQCDAISRNANSGVTSAPEQLKKTVHHVCLEQVSRASVCSQHASSVDKEIKIQINLNMSDVGKSIVPDVITHKALEYRPREFFVNSRGGRLIAREKRTQKRKANVDKNIYDVASKDKELRKTQSSATRQEHSHPVKPAVVSGLDSAVSPSKRAKQTVQADNVAHHKSEITSQKPKTKEKKSQQVSSETKTNTKKADIYNTLLSALLLALKSPDDGKLESGDIGRGKPVCDLNPAPREMGDVGARACVTLVNRPSFVRHAGTYLDSGKNYHRNCVKTWTKEKSHGGIPADWFGTSSPPQSNSTRCQRKSKIPVKQQGSRSLDRKEYTSYTCSIPVSKEKPISSFNRTHTKQMCNTHKAALPKTGLKNNTQSMEWLKHYTQSNSKRTNITDSRISKNSKVNNELNNGRKNRVVNEKRRGFADNRSNQFKTREAQNHFSSPNNAPFQHGHNIQNRKMPNKGSGEIIQSPKDNINSISSLSSQSHKVTDSFLDSGNKRTIRLDHNFNFLIPLPKRSSCSRPNAPLSSSGPYQNGRLPFGQSADKKEQMSRRRFNNVLERSNLAKFGTRSSYKCSSPSLKLDKRKMNDKGGAVTGRCVVAEPKQATYMEMFPQEDTHFHRSIRKNAGRVSTEVGKKKSVHYQSDRNYKMPHSGSVRAERRKKIDIPNCPFFASDSRLLQENFKLRSKRPPRMAKPRISDPKEIRNMPRQQSNFLFSSACSPPSKPQFSPMALNSNDDKSQVPKDIHLDTSQDVSASFVFENPGSANNKPEKQLK